MGSLTNDITRLCEEIQTLRAERHDLKERRAERTKARQVEVLETCAAFAGARNWKAESAHTARQNFVDSLKQTVAGEGKSLRDDLAAARRVWGRLRTA
jgi:signal transduction protein with GAF and PtsI domain